MTDLARDTSNANHGAAFEVTGALQTNYEGTYCRGAGARPREIAIGNLKILSKISKSDIRDCPGSIAGHKRNG